VAAAGPAAAGVPKHAKLAHILTILVSGVIALCVSSVLADGQSVIILKPVKDLPIVTNPELKKKVTLPPGSKINLRYNLAELLGPGYGVGLHHDQSGHIWNEAGAEDQDLPFLIKDLGIDAVMAAVPSVISTDGLKHPVHFLGCKSLERSGLAAMSFGFIAEVVAVLMVIFHALALAGMLPAKPAKMLAVLVWLVLSVGFLIVCMLAIAIYTTTWDCDQVIIPKIRLSDHFDYNYGFGFAIVGYLASLLVLCVQCAFTSTKDDEAGQPAPSVAKGLIKVVAGVVSGLVAAVVISMIVLGPNGGFDENKDSVYGDAKWSESGNPCEYQKPYHSGPGDQYFSNTQCEQDSIAQTLEQAGANVTKGYKGGLDAGSRVPITEEYKDAGLCAVNVHWHLGSEHLSVGQYDEKGTGPAVNKQRRDNSNADHPDLRRSLEAKPVDYGFRCHHYDAAKPEYTTPYEWKYCDKSTMVGETYEVHWPHSAAGKCGTEWQFQTPFYDGVFCRDGIITIAPLNTYKTVGVQGQVFTIVNDEDHMPPENLMYAAWQDETHWKDVAKYTGSTTGTSRDNEVCSRYTPITWQVDRTCHKVSAKAWDEMCKLMKDQKDDMTSDTHAHGARAFVKHALVANNQQSRK